MPGKATEAQKQEIARNLFLAANPSLAAAYKMNPQAKLGQSMVEAGSSTAPTAGGFAEGLSRIGSGLLGGLQSKRSQATFGAADDALSKANENAMTAARSRLAGGGGGGGAALPDAFAPGPLPQGAPPPQAPAIQVANAFGGGPISRPQGPPPAPPGGPPPVANAFGGGPISLPQGVPPGTPPATAVANAFGGGPISRPQGPGIPPPNPTVAPVQGRGALATGAVKPVAAALTAQPAEEFVSGSQAMPNATPIPAGALTPRSQRKAAARAGEPAPSPSTGLTPTTPTYVTNHMTSSSGPKTAADIPEQFRTYKSDAWDGLEEKYAKKYGVPSWMLRSIRLNGERSDWDQSSGVDGGTRTPYQFTGKTRNLFIKNKSIDPWSSPDAAVESAAIHLADDYRATKGDERETIARYHAGPSKTNRGDVNADYLARVTGKDATGARIGPEPTATGGIQVARAEVPGAPQVDIPDMPEERAAPERPALPERVQSLRLAMAEELIKGRKASGQRASLIAPSLAAEWEAGTKEESAYKEQERADLVQQLRDEYTSERSLYNDVTGAIRKQPLAERTAAISQRDTLQGKTYDAQIDAAAEEAEARNAIIKQREENEAQKERAQINAQRMDVGARKKYLENYGKTENITEIQRLLAARPNSVGLPFKGWDEATSRLDPEGVPLRSAIADLGTMEVHTRSGATVTANEWSRLKPFIPNVHDRNDVLKYKLDNFQRVINEEQQALEMMYGKDNPYIQGFGNILAPTLLQAAQAPGWSKP